MSIHVNSMLRRFDNDTLDIVFAARNLKRTDRDYLKTIIKGMLADNDLRGGKAYLGGKVLFKMVPGGA